MLSLTTISPKQGEKYYRKENYYTEEEAQKNSAWWGKGAENLGLKGSIKGEEFTNLLYGKSPDGIFDLSGKAIDPLTRRAGVDCTFSAPKSVSIKGLVGGDLDLEEAHKKAVNRTLEILQKRYAQTRVTTPEGRKAVNTNNLVVAQYHHDTSRAKDPQLHTHCVVLNMTQLPNGQWRSLHNDEIYKNKMLLGKIYRNELACEVQRLGYEIDRKENGLFEIKGYSPEQLSTFSKRSLEIKEAVGENASSKEKEYAALTTRIAKDKAVNRDDLLKYWQEEAKINNVAYQASDKLQNDKPKITAEDNRSKGSNKTRLDRDINNSIAHCSEREVNFKREDLEKFLLEEVGKYSWNDIENKLNFKEKTLLKAKEGEKTTTKALFRELNTIRFVEDNRNSVAPIAERSAVSNLLKDTSLTDGQRSAIATAATTSDRFIAWQGKAGVGKTYALNEFKQIAQQKGYEIKGFAPSAEAAKTLENELGIESNTVARLLSSKDKADPKQSKSSNKEQIWIVDEAGLLSADDAHSLVKKATQEKARVLLVGDTRQLSAVQAGNPFKSLQKAGIETAYLNQSLRQKAPDLKEAVDLISSGQIKAGIDILSEHNRIYDLGSTEDKIDRVVNDYLALSPQQRKKTLILAGRNDEREEITSSIRSALKQEGVLGKATDITQLKASSLTNAQLRYAHNFKLGDVVMSLRDYEKLKLKKGEFYSVIAKDRDKITIKDKSGKSYQLDPSQFRRKAVFIPNKLEIAEGDRLKWLKNDAKANRRNGQEFTVTKIKGNLATIKYDSGRTESIDLKSPQHLDRALVSTTYSSQGKTASRVLVSASGDRTLNRESFYVAASRAKYNLTIYIENKQALLQKSLKSAANKNPDEIIENLPEQHELAKQHLKNFFAAERAKSLVNKSNYKSVNKPTKIDNKSAKKSREEKKDNSQQNTNTVRRSR